MAEFNESPCSKGLTPECFKTFPAWAKRALFLRLLYLLLPVEITSKLPVIFRNPLFFLGPIFPPGWQPGDPPPDGAFIPTDSIFPPGWIFGDPWPEGVFLWEAFDPPAGLDLTDGIIVSPGTTFPDDWQPGDPLPEGAFDAATLPEDVIESGYSPSDFLGFSFFNRPGAPVGSFSRSSAYLYSDNFTVLDTDEWSTTISGSGDLDIVDGRLRMKKTSDSGFISITRADTTANLKTFTITFDLLFISGTTNLRIDYWSGAYHVYILFSLPGTVSLWDGSDWQILSLTDFTNIEHTWRFSINYLGCFIYRDDYLVNDPLDLEVDEAPSGTHRFVLEDTGEIRLDNFKLTGI